MSTLELTTTTEQQKAAIRADLSMVADMGDSVLNELTLVASTTGSTHAVYGDIGSYAFYNGGVHGRSYFHSVVIGSSCTVINERAFGWCNGITSVTIPEGVTTIGTNAFVWTNLTSVVLPESLTTLGDGAFGSCQQLTSVQLPSGIAAIGPFVFANCSSLRSIELPDGLESLIYACFAGAGLTSITIPGSVSFLHNSSFSGCPALTDLVIEPGALRYIDIYVFQNCPLLANVTLPEGLEGIYNSAFKNTPAMGALVLPDSLVTLGHESFMGSGVTSLTIGSSLTSIDQGAFMNCTRLTELVLPDSITTLWHYCFKGCNALASLTIGANLSSLGTYVFESCAFTSLTLGDQALHSTSRGAFRYCNSLSSLTLSEGFETVGSLSFAGCTALTTLTFPTTMVLVDDQAFASCTGLGDLYAQSDAFSGHADAFTGTPDAILWWKPGTSNWPATWAGIPTGEWTSYPDPMPALTAPALDFNPAVTKSFSVVGGVVHVDSEIGPSPAFSRASGGTFTDVDGLVKWGPENLLTRSEDFTQWSQWGGTFVTVEPGVADPDGGFTATRLTAIAANANIFNPVGVDGQATLRFWMRAPVATEIVVEVHYNQTISVGTEWAEYALVDSGLFFTSFNIPNGKSVDIWHPQISRSDCQYIPTAASPVYGPRFEHDPVTHACNGLMLEGQATNLCYPSRASSGEVGQWHLWANVQGALPVHVGESSTSPVDFEGGDTWEFPGTGVTEAGVIYANVASSSSGNHCVSLWLKATRQQDVGRVVLVGISNNAGTTSGEQSVTLTSEWAQCYYAKDLVSVGGFNFDIVAFGTGGDPLRVDIAARQAETGTRPSSYIPTTTAAVTRSADVLSPIGGTDFTGFFGNGSAGTFVCDYVPNFVRSYTTFVGCAYDNMQSFSNFIDVARHDNDYVLAASAAAGVAQSNISGYFTATGTRVTTAHAFAANDVAFCVNGDVVGTDQTFTPPTGLTALSIGSLEQYYPIKGTVARLRFWPERLPDARLRRLT